MRDTPKVQFAKREDGSMWFSIGDPRYGGHVQGDWHLGEEWAKVLAWAITTDAINRYRWRPIADIHEDYGECILLDINDPGGPEIGNNCSLWFDEEDWTHFAQLPELTNEMADEMIAGLPKQTLSDRLEDMEELEQMCEDRERES